MYSAIIIDDEEIIRKGLGKFIPWRKIGFEVVETFEDGRPAIEFLRKNHVDLIFTDIIMNDISGLEVAKFVHENYPNTVVCIIRGYKDFEYAREAMKYNVKRFIIKPTDIPDTIKLVESIKDALDEEKSNKNTDYTELLSKARQQFFTNVFLGVFPTEASVLSEAKSLNISEDSFICSSFWIKFVDYKLFKSNVWKYGQDRIYIAINNFLQNQHDIIFQNILISDDRIMALAQKFCKEEKSVFQDQLHNILESAKESMHNILNLKIEINYGPVFDRLSSVIQFLSTPITVSHNILSTDDEILLQEKYKSVILAITLNHQDILENSFCSIQNILKFVTANELKTIILKFLSTIFETVANTARTSVVDYNNAYSTDIKLIKNASSQDEVFSICRLVLHALFQQASAEMNSEKIVNRAIEFINNHYQNDISLEDVANYVFLNPAYFSRFFKKHTGENFRNYLIKIRINKAIDLLKSESCKISEISKLVGYNNRNYFTSQFKSITGTTPSQYLQKSNGGNYD